MPTNGREPGPAEAGRRRRRWLRRTLVAAAVLMVGMLVTAAWVVRAAIDSSTSSLGRSMDQASAAAQAAPIEVDQVGSRREVVLPLCLGEQVREVVIRSAGGGVVRYDRVGTQPVPTSVMPLFGASNEEGPTLDVVAVAPPEAASGFTRTSSKPEALTRARSWTVAIATNLHTYRQTIPVAGLQPGDAAQGGTTSSDPTVIDLRRLMVGGSPRCPS